MSAPLVCSDALLAAFARLQTPVWMFDVERESMFWANGSAVQLWGAPDLSALQARDFSGMPDETRRCMNRCLQSLLETGTPNACWNPYPQGYPQFADCHCSAITLPDGRPAMLVERLSRPLEKTDLDSLRMAEAMRHTSAMVSLYTLEGAPVMRNPSAQRAYGDPEAMPALSLWELPVEGAVSREMRAAVERGELFSDLFQIHTTEGERWHGCDVRVVVDPMTREPHILVNSSDLTEQKLVGQALQARETMYRQMFENNSAVKLLIDPLDGVIVRANRAACEYYGYPEAVLKGMQISEINILSSKEIKQEIAIAQASQQKQFRFRHRLSSGVIRDVEVHTGPVTIDGKQYLYSIVFDVTRRNEYESQLAALNREVSSERQRLDDILMATQAGTWEWDFRSGELILNERWAGMLGYTLEELAPISIETWRTLCHPDDLDRANKVVWQLISREMNYYECDVRLRHKDQRWIWVLARGQIVEWGSDGEPLRMSGTHTDITESKQAEWELKLAASVFTHAREGILITDRNGIIIDANKAFTRITGYGYDEVVGGNPSILRSGRHDEQFYHEMWQTISEAGYWSGEVWDRRKNGELYVEYLTISAVYDKTRRVQNYVGIFSDITSAKRQQKELEHLAHYDALTGLPNRVLLGDRLRQAMARLNNSDRALALAFIDLDGFKEINDRHGHKRGDELLRVIARRMENVLREEDTLARLGGDEFVAVVSNLEGHAACEEIITRLLQAARVPVLIDNNPVAVSASIGVSFYPQESHIEADQLLRQADQAMYQAKLLGKNDFAYFSPERDHRIRGHHEHLEQIRQALVHNQFVLHYQPKVNLRSGELVGVEALLRWNHPERGLLPPLDFLPAIENLPISVDLGEWVINHALQQVESWAEEHLVIPVSVNITAYHLQTERFSERLREMLSRYPAVDPACLQIELLETSAIEDLSRVVANMKACAELGVSFALDDFGTGYSSLVYLKRLPVSTIKIDQGFVRDILQDIDDLTITTGVLGIANAYRLPCIAEGVETEEHCETLLRLGCELAQGYGIAMPMPADKLVEWLRQWSPSPRWEAVREVGPEHLSALYAETEHRAWLNSVLDELEAGGRQVVDDGACGMGKWLADFGEPLYNGHYLYSELCELLSGMKYEAERLVSGDIHEKACCREELALMSGVLIAKMRELVALA